MSLSICLIFCQFQPGIAYKSVAYKKKRVIGRLKEFRLVDHTLVLNLVDLIDEIWITAYAKTNMKPTLVKN